jgi:hypothetical protein
MPFQSNLFRGDPKLEAAAESDPAHVLTGAAGEHVARIQQALLMLDDAEIDPGELNARRYGTTTAAAVLAYKQKRKIINAAYQTQADNIVGKMTIAAMDNEIWKLEQTVTKRAIHCGLGDNCRGGRLL